MAYDKELFLTGTGSTPTETVTADGASGRGGVNVGANRLFTAELRIGGAVSGTSPTLDEAIQDSADSPSFATIASFPQQTASPRGSSDYAVPGTEPVKIAFRTRTGRPYVRVLHDVGGTTPSFGGVSVQLTPVMERG